MREVEALLTTVWAPLRSRLYRNTAYLWSGTIASAFLGFAFWNVVARLYSPDAVGLAGPAVTSLGLLATVSQLGLGHALIRFIPQDQDGAPALVSRSLVVVAVASFLAGLIMLATLPVWSQDLRGLLLQGPGNAVAYLLFVVFATVSALLNSTFIAYLRSVFVLAQRLTLGLLRIPLAVVLAGSGSAIGIVAGHGLALLAGIFLAALVFLPRCTGRMRLPLALDVVGLYPVAPFALSNLASQLLMSLAWQVLPLLVIAQAGAQEAGFFYIGWAVAAVMLAMTQQLGLSLFAEGSHNVRGLRRQAVGALFVGMTLGGLFAVAVYFLGDTVLLLFGREYAEHTNDVLRLLAAAAPLAAVTHVSLGVLRARGRMVSLVTVAAAVNLIMVGATAMLVPSVGIVGAGYGAVAGYGIGALLGLPLLYPLMRRGRESVGVGRSEMTS